MVCFFLKIFSYRHSIFVCLVWFVIVCFLIREQYKEEVKNMK